MARYRRRAGVSQPTRVRWPLWALLSAPWRRLRRLWPVRLPVRLLSDLAAAGRPDVVYLDPMYPERQKSAAVKKEMAYFHQLIGSAQNTDDAELLAAARDVATKRIVVKRPRLGALLAQCTPAYQYSGKSTRFDIYLPTRPSVGE